MKEKISPVGRKMEAIVPYIIELLERAGVDTREFSVQYSPESKDSQEGIEWMHLRDDGDSDCYVSFTENGASVIEHKIEDPSNLWPDGARVFMKREPQLALLRQPRIRC